jgi:tetratricopeptide (TPR) repeat protein
MKNLDTLDKLHPDIISAFLATGKSDGIPEPVQLFLKQLQWAAEIYEYERNITRAAKQLQTRIATLQQIYIDIRTCKARIYAAINYFSIDSSVSIKIWESNFADKYEDLAKLCALRGDYKTMKECYREAAECRRRASQIAEADRDLGIVFLITPDITPEQMGYAKKNLKEIAKKHNDGFYLDLINSLPVEIAEKKRLLRDADIQEAEIIEETGEY